MATTHDISPPCSRDLALEILGKASKLKSQKIDWDYVRSSKGLTELDLLLTQYADAVRKETLRKASETLNELASRGRTAAPTQHPTVAKLTKAKADAYGNAADTIKDLKL